MEKRYIETFSDNFEKINDEFVKCTISVLSCDQVANGTKFTKEGVEKASSTLNYAPVIGYFNGDDFEDHGQELVISNDGMDFKVKTIPFGVVIKDSQRWNKIMKDNGEYEEYLCVDAYLWSRYNEATKRVKDNLCNQSMEVNVNMGEYKEEGYFEITDFNFSGLCILGENVAPAFNLAKIRTLDKFSKDDFKVNYQEMLDSLNSYLNEEGGEDVENQEVKEPEIEEVESGDEIVVTEEDVADEIIEDQEEKVDYAEIITSLRNEIATVRGEYSVLEEEVISLREYKSEKESEIRLSQEKDLFNQYDNELSDISEYKELKNNSNDYTIDELEEKVLVVYGRFMKTKNKNKKNFTKEPQVAKMKVETQDYIHSNGAWDIIKNYK